VKPHTDDDMTTPNTLRVLASWPDRVTCLRCYSPAFVAERTGLPMNTVYSYRKGARTVPLDVLTKVTSDVSPPVDIVEACGMVLMVEPA